MKALQRFAIAVCGLPFAIGSMTLYSTSMPQEPPAQQPSVAISPGSASVAGRGSASNVSASTSNQRVGGRASLRGRVLSASGKPVQGATVILTNTQTDEPRQVISGMRGVYVFNKVFQNDYTLQASTSDKKSKEIILHVQDDKMANQDLVIQGQK
jgi:hypothetical protein